jgi:hypothetical protein
LYLVLAWTVTLAALNQFSGEYSLTVLFVYALFGAVAQPVGPPDARRP